MTVQRNATSSFEYDGLDRVVRALVRHEYVYPLVALVEEVNAYEYGVRSIVSYAPGGAVENSIEFRYDPNNKLASETQSHESKKNWSKAVAYSYEADGGYPVPRLSGITYPSGRTVTYLCAKGTEDWSRKDWACEPGGGPRGGLSGIRFL